MFGIATPASAHAQLAIRQLERTFEANPTSLIELAAQAGKAAGVASVYLPTTTLAKAVRLALKKKFPNLRFSVKSGPCGDVKIEQTQGPRVWREQLQEALGRLASREGNMTDSSSDFFDRTSGAKLEDVRVVWPTIYLYGFTPIDNAGRAWRGAEHFDSSHPMARGCDFEHEDGSFLVAYPEGRLEVRVAIDRMGYACAWHVPPTPDRPGYSTSSSMIGGWHDTNGNPADPDPELKAIFLSFKRDLSNLLELTAEA